MLFFCDLRRSRLKKAINNHTDEKEKKKKMKEKEENTDLMEVVVEASIIYRRL